MTKTTRSSKLSNGGTRVKTYESGKHVRTQDHKDGKTTERKIGRGGLLGLFGTYDAGKKK